ncbi:YadA C-terminal domain-containing protein [Haemophilus influenzae]|uniref:Adhesin YadA n=1 Tax=Haemophilus influenzae TaxID=727 RepID=A0AAX3IR05_HAEIF|nr:YadA C-terminal domain-containing protein [Haemophilus influenzae]VTX52554.1 Adhesin YadA [Haemophilus influenzae]
MEAKASGPDTVAVGLLSKVKTVEAYNNEYGNSKKIDLEALKKSYVRQSGSTAILSNSITSPTRTLSKTPEELEQIYGKTYVAAFGMHSSSHALTASAYGTYSTAIGRYSTSLGSSSTAVDEDSTAVGNRSLAYAKSVAKHSVAVGYMSFADRENSVSVGDSSTNFRRQIVNVADGTEDYDAVNVRQLNAVETKIGQVNNQFAQVDNKFTQVNNRLDGTETKLGQIDNQFTQVNNNFTQVNNRLDGTETKLGQIDNQFTHVNTHLNRTDLRINRVGASAAALASLKPAQLGEDDKFALFLGVGSYKNTQAMAMGAVFKPVENVLLNVAGSFSGSEKTFGAGVSWKFGNKSKPAVSTQSAVNSAEVLQLRQEVVMMRSQQVETNKKLHKQAEMESELKQLRRELLELKKALKK